MKYWNRHNAIAVFVRAQRKESKMTQSELSDLTGVGLRFVRDLEQLDLMKQCLISLKKRLKNFGNALKKECVNGQG